MWEKGWKVPEHLWETVTTIMFLHLRLGWRNPPRVVGVFTRLVCFLAHPVSFLGLTGIAWGWGSQPHCFLS